jgi:hypothetical protein
MPSTVGSTKLRRGPVWGRNPAGGAVYGRGSLSPFWSLVAVNGPSRDMSTRMLWSRVISPPHAHAERSLQAESLLRSPEGVESADRLRIAPPVRRPPHGALRVDTALARESRLLAQKLIDRTEGQLRPG